MMHRPQRTEDRLRAGGEDGAYLCGSLEGGGELKQWPRAQLAEAVFGWCASTGWTAALCCRGTAREHCSGTVRAAQHCTRRARGAGVAEQ